MSATLRKRLARLEELLATTVETPAWDEMWAAKQRLRRRACFMRLAIFAGEPMPPETAEEASAREVVGRWEAAHGGPAQVEVGFRERLIEKLSSQSSEWFAERAERARRDLARLDQEEAACS